MSDRIVTDNVLVTKPFEVEVRLAHLGDARDSAVQKVLNAPVGTGDGRSEWFWVRLYNGDLFLAVAPQGATYEELEGEPGTGWEDSPEDHSVKV